MEMQQILQQYLSIRSIFYKDLDGFVPVAAGLEALEAVSSSQIAYQLIPW